MPLEPINTSTILTTSDPVPTTDINVPGWIVTETMEVSFGDYTGRPDVEHTQLAREMLAYFFQQGWFIVAVISAGSNGKWVSVRSTKTEEKSTSKSDEKVDSTSTEKSESQGTSSFASNAGGFNDGTNWSTGASGSSVAESKGSSEAKGTSTSVGNKSDTKSGSTSSGTEGISDAYWSSWQKVRLQRKRIHPRKVLESMVGELVTSYKKGEKAVADRYTAVVSLYTTMLSRSETEVGKLNDELTSFKDLMDGAMAAIKGTLDSITPGGDDDQINEAAEYQRKTINEKFDALVASEKGRLITAGLFNSTQWTMIAAGIERERGVALLAVSDKILGWKRDMASVAAGLAPALASAAKTVWDAGKEGTLEPTKLRNEVLKWMLDYCERHNTERSKIQEIAQIPKVLDGVSHGYAEK